MYVLIKETHDRMFVAPGRARALRGTGGHVPSLVLQTQALGVITVVIEG